MSELQTKFNQLIEEQRALAQKFQETAQSLFKETTKEFFDKNPGVNAAVWTQYTPYFNDGDTCEFNVNDVSFTNASGEDLQDNARSISWGEYEGEEENIWVAESWSMNSTGDWGKEIQEKLNKAGGVDVKSCELFSKMVCSSEMENVMKAMFGDHVLVIATRDGFDVEEYDHD